MADPERMAREGSRSVAGRDEVQRAWRLIQDLDAWTRDRQMELTAIPAPPFGETERAGRMAELFLEAGIEYPEVDTEGNVLATLNPDPSGKGGEEKGTPGLVLSAHLDTVFPAGTPVEPRVEGDRIYAPGISDDGRGLAVLLSVAKTLVSVPFSLPFSVIFAATVGEEGPGNLRGVRHLFSDPAPWSRGFVSLDGTGLDRIICRGIGSVRLRISVHGAGGHSWTDFGIPNPIHVLGRIVGRLEELALPRTPRTTLTVARWGGGSSINSIPQTAWLEMDLRSEGGGELQELEREVRSVVEAEVEAGARRAAPGDPLSVTWDEIGRRPPGQTDPSDPLVQAALEATRILGEEPILVGSSTDANLPMSLGIPAVTLGGGGASGGIHTPGEWYENRKGPEGVFRALLTLLLLADQVAGP